MVREWTREERRVHGQKIRLALRRELPPRIRTGVRVHPESSIPYFEGPADECEHGDIALHCPISPPVPITELMFLTGNLIQETTTHGGRDRRRPYEQEWPTQRSKPFLPLWWPR